MEGNDIQLRRRVTATLALFMAGLDFIVVAHLLHDWMIWATGALTMRFGFWLGED